MTRINTCLGGLTLALALAPALARTAPPTVSFDNQVQAFARVWSAPPADCTSPLRQSSLTSEAEVAAFKADIRTYQVCLKMALGTIQARQSPEPLVGPTRWAAMSDSQKAKLQDTLETANRTVIEGIVAKGSQVASGARETLGEWQAQVFEKKRVLAEARNAQEVADGVSKINSCGPRLSRLKSRGRDLDDESATIKSEENSLLMMSINISGAAALGDAGRYNSMVSEARNQEYQHNRKVDKYNERVRALNSDNSDFKDECGGLSLPRQALDKACDDEDNKEFCSRFNR